MKSYRPTTPSRRHMTVKSYKGRITAKKPLKSLTHGRKRSVGRNADGRITSRHKGAGVKRLWREIDFRFDKKNIPARVEEIEYDPNRSAYIARLCYRDGERRYIVAARDMKQGDSMVVGEKVRVAAGNRMPLGSVPVGTFVHLIETKPGGGARIARSAGNYAEVVAQDAPYTHLKLPSTETRKLLSAAWASIGVVSNEEHHLVVLGKAGRSRQLGRRPTVRGTAMNPVDHPHGGGEGRQGRGHRRARSIFGKPTGKGQKTRTPKKYSNKLIVSRRKVGKKRSK